MAEQMAWGVREWTPVTKLPGDDPAPEGNSHTEPGLPEGRLAELRAALVDIDGLKAIPPPDPIIDGWLFRDSLAWLGGKPGNGKTFVAIDIACCVSTGTTWHGRDTRPGPVLYLIAEGASGLAQRVDAWQLARGRRAGGVMFLPVAVQLMHPVDAEALCRLLAERAPRLVILDTQARVTVGAEENSSRDMGMFVHTLERLRQASGACILTVHHEPRSSENLRGSTALEGAATSILRVSKDGSLLEISNPKQKDTPGQDGLMLALTPIGVSATVELATAATMTDSQRALLATLRDFGSTGATTTQLQRVSGMAERSFYRAKDALEKQGLITNVGSAKRTRWIPVSLDDRKELP